MTDEPSSSPSEGGPYGPAAAPLENNAVNGFGWGHGRWSRVRLALLRLVAILGAFVFIMGLLTAFAGIYTSRPEFCRSCHIMEPYYVSWKHSSHGHVSCIKCHFPPGAGEKIRGKMLGLVQLVKYVTSSEGPRPAAEVSDASCLRSGCHETRLLAGRVNYNGVPFDHRPHLQQMRRGKKLRCTSCHSQIVQGSHMTVTTSTCFLCHFKGEQFNQGLGTCTRCHQIPDKQFDLGGGVSFDHDLAYERGVNCANCHGDLIRGEGEVPRERCAVCHNREHDLERIGDHEFLHQKHVTEHKVDCLECHLEIHHAPDQQRIEHAASDCSSCHPDHHRDQVNMLKGVGGHAATAESNVMVAARLTCPSCHQAKTVSSTGAVVWAGSTRTCEQCHDASAIAKLWSSSQLLRDSLTELAEAAARARIALNTAELSASRRAEFEAQLTQFEDDIRFLHVANGIHNIHYAGTLTRELVKKLTTVCRQLRVAPPNVTLPERSEPES